MKYLINYSDNWADEMDVSGHVVLNQKEYKKFQKAISHLVYNKIEFEFSVGSNEYIEYGSYKSADSVYSVTEISDEDYKVLKKLDLTESGFAGDFVENVIEAAEESGEE